MQAFSMVRSDRAKSQATMGPMAVEKIRMDVNCALNLLTVFPKSSTL